MLGDVLQSDAELQNLFVNGNDDVFTILYKRYQFDIKCFVARILKSPDLAEDVTQEVFLKIWNSRKQLSEVKIFKAYLFVSARNHALNHLKKALRSETTMNEVIYHFIDQRNTTEEDLLSKEYELFLKQMLDSLPERSREIFSLCREQGRSYDEVASALGVSRNAVKNHMVYSMKILRNATEKELGISLSVLLAILFKS